MASSGFLNINGNDLINVYYLAGDTINTSTFTGVNTFTGSTVYNVNVIAGTSVSYTSSTVPNFALAKNLNQSIAFTLPISGVPDGFILYFRRNNGAAAVTYTFSPSIYNQNNGSISTLVSSIYSFSLIKYNNNWWIHHPPI